MRLGKRYSRLDGDIGQLLVVVKNAIESLQADDHAAVRRGNPRTVAPVLTGADWIDGSSKTVGNAETFLQLVAAGGSNNSGYFLGCEVGRGFY